MHQALDMLFYFKTDNKRYCWLNAYNQLARLFTAMKYKACLVDQCLQCGMMFFWRHNVRANFLLLDNYFLLLFKTRKVSQENQYKCTNYNSNASVKLFLYSHSINADRISNEIINTYWAICTRVANIKATLKWNFEARRKIPCRVIWSILNGSV